VSSYVASTDWRLCDTPCGIRRSHKEVHVRASLTKRDARQPVPRVMARGESGLMRKEGGR